MNYAFHLGIYFAIYLLLAGSLSLKVGYAGLLSLAQASHFAVGAYSTAILMAAFNWPFALALPASIIVASLGGALLATMGRGARGDLYVLVTLAFQALLSALLINWSSPSAPLGSLRNLTNGSFGISDIPSPSIGSYSLAGAMRYFPIALAVAAAGVYVLWRLDRSPWAKSVIAVRDDELAARAIGKQPNRLLTQVSVISAGLAGLAGALYTGYAGYLDPSSADLNESLMLLSIVLLGGTVGLIGPAIGAAIFVLVPELLRAVNVGDVSAGNIRLALFGALLLVLAHARPQGIAGRHAVQ